MLNYSDGVYASKEPSAARRGRRGCRTSRKECPSEMSGRRMSPGKRFETSTDDSSRAKAARDRQAVERNIFFARTVTNNETRSALASAGDVRATRDLVRVPSSDGPSDARCESRRLIRLSAQSSVSARTPPPSHRIWSAKARGARWSLRRSRPTPGWLGTSCNPSGGRGRLRFRRRRARRRRPCARGRRRESR